MAADNWPMPFERVYTGWREWYAWRPVRLIDNSWVWGKRIYRRKSWLWLSVRGPVSSEYGTLLNVLSTTNDSYDDSFVIGVRRWD